MFINIIGCDGCGKTTQINLVQSWLEKAYSCSVDLLTKKTLFNFEAFPDSKRFFGCSYRELMYELLPKMPPLSRAMFLFYMFSTLLGTINTKGTPSFHSCLFQEGMDLIEKQEEPRLYARGQLEGELKKDEQWLVDAQKENSDKIILMDGGWDKHIAAEAAMGISFQWLRSLCAVFPKPALSIFLDIEPDVIIARRIQNNYGAHAPYECGCLETTDINFKRQMTSMSLYLRKLAIQEGWITLNANQPVQILFQAIKDIISSHLGIFSAGLAIEK